MTPNPSGKILVAFSGGKDSTAMAMRLAEMGEPFELLFTPTGNELPEVMEHVHALAKRLNRTLHMPPGPKLEQLIEQHHALPSHAARWCTRMIKIDPCKAFLLRHPGSTLLVGLRADEEERTGLFGPYATYRYPLREWGWKITDVWAYLKDRGISVPSRTDCAWCYDQRLSDWYDLWKKHPALYAEGEAHEEKAGHTFRSPGRDTQPVQLVQLRRKFESGYVPRDRELVEFYQVWSLDPAMWMSREAEAAAKGTDEGAKFAKRLERLRKKFESGYVPGGAEPEGGACRVCRL